MSRRAAVLLGTLAAECMFICGAIGPSSAAAANKQPATIKDLEGQQVDISPDPPQGVDNNKTMGHGAGGWGYFKYLPPPPGRPAPWPRPPRR